MRIRTNVYLNFDKSHIMENENKDKVILTDEELKEVAGGASPKFAGCMHYRKIEECVQKSDLCRWSNGKFVSKLG